MIMVIKQLFNPIMTMVSINANGDDDDDDDDDDESLLIPCRHSDSIQIVECSKQSTWDSYNRRMGTIIL